jgi:hypothetical protein
VRGRRVLRQARGVPSIAAAGSTTSATASPPPAMIRRIADLENTIAAVLALIEERQGG